ncbi:MAG TPA: vWA domain-containing protein, partial [Dehalococcoidia bacterium]
PKMWLPAPLSGDYQGSPGLLNPFSLLVSTTSCVDRASGRGDVPGPHTDLGSPMKAATDELLNNGRVSAEKGIVFLSDGAANIIDPAISVAAGVNGPCDYAMKMATEAKDQGIEIYTIAYGADDTCDHDKPGTTWYRKDATELLEAMATDAEHYFYEPRTADLDPVFEAIGIQLGGSTKLIR